MQRTPVCALLLVVVPWPVRAAAPALQHRSVPAGATGLDRAIHRMIQKDYVGALADFEKLRSQPSPDPLVHFQIGVCQTVLGRYPEALESFERARAGGLDRWEVWSGIGTIHFNQGDHARSREQFERVLRAEKAQPTALFYLGRIDLKEKRHAAAEQRFHAVLAVDPGHEGALLNLGLSLVLQGRIAEGERVLEHHRKTAYLHDRLRTLRDMARSPAVKASTLAELGDLYLEAGDPKRALEAIQRAERLAPGTPLTSLGRGRLSYAAGDFPVAERHLRRAAQTTPARCEAQLFLGLALKEQRKQAEAFEALERALAACPREMAVLENLAELEIQRKNLDRAMTLSATIVRLDPASPAGPYIEAVCRLYRRDLDGAERAALEAARLDPKNPEYHRLLRAIYLARGEAEKARMHEAQLEALLGRKAKG